MEDIINALLDVVRAQHTATQGTDETPFGMDDVIDMAMNLLGRPDDKAEEEAMIDDIQKMVESMAPDIFPPKTFEQMDDDEKFLSASNMIENRFARGTNDSSQSENTVSADTVQPSYSYNQEEEEEEEPDPGDLNDLIYKNFMEMMGLSSPKVEYPFDRSQIVYGKEKTATEMLAEEAEEKRRRDAEDMERDRKLSAWELAQNVIDQDEAAHAKEEYVPQPVEPPTTKSASQMANEAIRKAEEEKRMKLEIERQAEALMAEAKRRGKNPMDFMLHQQEILRYMEKNSDELVSFEDYEDLSPEEKLEIERQVYIERQLADGVNPDEVDREVPEEYIPEELKKTSEEAEKPEEGEEEKVTTFDDDVLRALSQQVLSENSDMILSENADEDMTGLQEELFQNLKRMMAGSGTPVPQENVASLLSQAAANQMSSFEEKTENETEDTPVVPEPVEEKEPVRPMSAVELARAAQQAAKPQAAQPVTPEEVTETLEDMDLTFDEMDDLFEASSEPEETPQEEPAIEMPSEDTTETSAEENEEKTEGSETAEEEPEADEEESDISESAIEETDSSEELSEEEYEYVDPDEMVLGEHTQAEIDEALENLNSLGLEGEVYERAKRMLLLELANSEAELDAWLLAQEQGKKKKTNRSALDEDGLDDLSDFDEDLFEKELDMAIEKGFEEEIPEIDEPEDPDLGEGSEESEEKQEDGESEGIERIDFDEGQETDGEAEPAEEKEEVDRSDVDDSATDLEEAPEEPKEESEEKIEQEQREEKGHLSIRKPFILKNATSFIDKLEDFITENQENRRLSTGFKKLDTLLRFGLHKGSYFIDSRPQYLKNAFMQQIADRAAETGVDVLYISTELSRYDLMVDTLSRLSYEMNGHDSEKAHSVMSIMTGEGGATLDQLTDELNWYRGRISEHLFILDQEAVDEFIDSLEGEVSAGEILEELIRSIVTEGTHKPVVFIDNIENILSAEDSEDMKPLMDGIGKLSKELSIPIIMSYGYEQAENEAELSSEEREFHTSLGNMCDVYLEIEFADMITEESGELTEQDIREMVEDGDNLLFNVMVYRNRRPMRASCQIQGTPKYNYFEE